MNIVIIILAAFSVLMLVSNLFLGLYLRRTLTDDPNVHDLHMHLAIISTLLTIFTLVMLFIRME